MTDLVRTRPESFFSDRFSITSDLMERVLGGNLIGKVDDADIYLEYRVNEELVLEEGAVKKASRHVSQGAGVRAQSATRTGYAHTDEISLKNLEEAARQARAIADRSTASGTLALPSRGRPHDLYTLAEPPIAADLARKLDLLRRIDAETRATDPRIKQVIASITSEEVIMLIATASGWTVGDIRPLTRLNVTTIAEDGGKREIGSYGGGGRVTFDFFLEEGRWRRFAGDAARQRARRFLRLCADAAHAQHVHARGAGRSRGDPQIGEARPLRRDLRRRSGRHHQRQVRLLGERGLPGRGREDHGAGQGGDPDRQRPGGAHAGFTRRERPEARRGRRHLRQRRPVGAGGRRPADDPHRRHHRRGHGGMKPARASLTLPSVHHGTRVRQAER